MSPWPPTERKDPLLFPDLSYSWDTSPISSTEITTLLYRLHFSTAYKSKTGGEYDW